MSTSSKFGISSGSPDRPLYAPGQRGAHLAVQLERSGSFRESVENPILASLPNMSRNFFQCLRFDPKEVAAHHKSNRQVEFKQHVNIALGISTDDSPTGSSKGKLLQSPKPEEIKRMKNGLRDSVVKARERIKIFNEALSVFNKFFPSIPSKKRSRLEGFSNERSGALVSSDRSVSGPGLSKMGIQSHVMNSGFDVEQPKSEERTKNVVPNKRTRTSMMDVRNNSLVKPAGVLDRDISRLANSGAVQGEDRTLSVGVDGWEKAKMKKKRSGIKADGSPSMASSKHVDGYRESKQGMQQRPVNDNRSRLSSDSHGFRFAVANGTVGVGKSDGILQQTGLTVRSSNPRADMDNSSLLSDKRDCPGGSEKERGHLRAVNKANVRDEFNSASPTSNTKLNASVRGPRSGSGVAPKLSPILHRATAPGDWEISNCTNKPPAAGGVSNRKRTASNRSSSPPVAHWASQRPQKISRIARRTNFVPIVSSHDESHSVDTVSDAAGNDLGLGFPKRLAGNSPQQVKLKGDTFSSATLSESEESGAAEIKSKDKGKKSDDIDDKAVHNIQKMSTLVLPSRKNKLAAGEELGDGVRRQGRTGRGFTSTRSLMPMTVDKLGNVGTAKQLRSMRLGFDKTESKAGRPPTRKLSDRKAYTRVKHAAANATMDFLVGSADGHEELLAAVSAIISAAHAFSSPFWRRMEPYFGLISDVDITFLKQQGSPEYTAPVPKPIHSNIAGCGSVPNGYEHEADMGLVTEEGSGELLTEELLPSRGDPNAVSLYQRFLAALIPQEDCSCGSDDVKYDGYGTGFELDPVIESNGSNHIVDFESARHTTFNGYRMTGRMDDEESEIDELGIPNKGINSNGMFSNQALVPSVVSSELQYDTMQINEKIFLEAQSIGIFLEPMSDIMQTEDEAISEDICKLEEKYHEQVYKKNGLINTLLVRALELKDIQEKEFDQRAYDKLVSMAYEKYMACRGTHATGGKSSSNKLAKQAALAFVKHTLERCHQYEDEGNSCFNDPVFRDMFISGCAHPADTPTDNESTKPYAKNSSRNLNSRVSASMGSQPSPLTSRIGQNGDSYANSSDLLPSLNCLSERSIDKEDIWSNRVKKRELLLDDVGGIAGTSASTSAGIGNSLSSSTKGKRSERDREGKGHGREVLPRNGNKIGRPAISNAKGERKSKTKPKQKTTQLSVSVNGLLGKMSDQPKSSLSKSSEIINSNAKEKNEFSLDVLDDSEAIDLSGLQIPEMDCLGGTDDLGSQAQDLSTWLNIDEDGLQDHDFMGLEIPMDDLSDLNMMV